MNRRPILSVLCLSALTVSLWGAETPGQAGLPNTTTAAASVSDSSANASSAVSTDDLRQLRKRIAKQEEEIKQLQQSVEEQRTLLEKAVENSVATPAEVNTVNASASSSDRSAPVQLVPAVNVARPRIALGRQNLQAANPMPLSINIGNSTFTPLGFVDATFYGRTTNIGSGIGTNFSAAPYSNAVADHAGENNLTTQNSRIGFRVDSNVMGSKVLGYVEADFLGNQAGNVFVTSNADTFRMRNVFVDVQKDGFEVLAGQDWSLATPNRKGLSPLPSDIFYTQNMDTNYQAGLVWSRQTQFRFIAHPSDNFAYGASLENPQQYIGGSGGLNGGAVTVPAAASLSGLPGTQINNGATNFTATNWHPDIIFKAAYDGIVGSKKQVMHIEAVGLLRSFKDSFALSPTGTPLTTGTASGYRTNTATAVSGEVNANLEVVKNFRIIANTFFGSGNGRYVFGLAPDFILRADGSISPIHTYSTVDGFEVNLHKNTLLDAYYGGIYIKRNAAFDANGTSRIGYGYPGSSANDNRTIQEGTIGITQTFWKSPTYGALSLITQFSYLTRNPWAVATGTSKVAHSDMYWVDLRYTLP